MVRPISSKVYADLFKSLVDVAALSLRTGEVRRVYETAAQGWEDLERGKMENPFRLFLRMPTILREAQYSHLWLSDGIANGMIQ